MGLGLWPLRLKDNTFLLFPVCDTLLWQAKETFIIQVARHQSSFFKGCHVTQLPSPHTTLETPPRGAELSTVLPMLTSIDLEITPLLRRPDALGGFRLQLSEGSTKIPTSPNPVLLELLLNHSAETSLAVQWLRLCTPSAAGPSSIPGQGTRSHMLQLTVCMPQLKIIHAAKKIEDPECCS